jgi:hypothetical protein
MGAPPRTGAYHRPNQAARRCNRHASALPELLPRSGAQCIYLPRLCRDKASPGRTLQSRRRTLPVSAVSPSHRGSDRRQWSTLRSGRPCSRLYTHGDLIDAPESHVTPDCARSRRHHICVVLIVLSMRTNTDIDADELFPCLYAGWQPVSVKRVAARNL